MLHTLSNALWQMPLAYFLGAALALLVPNSAWRIAHGVTIAAFVLALSGAVAMLAGAAHPAVALPALLVTGVAWVIVRYSRDYLRGEPRQVRYVSSLLFTLGSVCVVVVTDHLGLLLAAWAASSIGLHRLLMFYPERVGAQVAAHKKFIASRAAELCLLVAVVLIAGSLDSLSIGTLNDTLAGTRSLPWQLEVAAVLVAITALLKSAQLPLHGWLMQVMEAPTPVSALLHAGIVNLGGIVVIRLSELFSASFAAQLLLVLVGGGTALVAGMVMLTRVSIKVRLAWSTCAQMGFMLVECGLGLYELAMLHILAHSLYKAHAFLSAGSTVQRAESDALLPDTARLGASAWTLAIGVCVAAGLVHAGALLHALVLDSRHLSPIAQLILALGLAPLVTPTARWGARSAGVALARAAGLVGLYLLWHSLLSELIPAGEPSFLLSAVAAAVFLAFFLIQSRVLLGERRFHGGRLYRAAYAGFYLDESFTRLTFRLWPLSLQRPDRASQSLNLDPSRGTLS
jgi:NAD(P)H-quinone oxidoreductase subunit 5